MKLMVDLYEALRADSRLQRDWERNQPRIDRALESPLIARTPREVATACLLAIKLRFEPHAAGLLDVKEDGELVTFGRSQGSGGVRLANVIEGKIPVVVVSSLPVHQCGPVRSHGWAHRMHRIFETGFLRPTAAG